MFGLNRHGRSHSVLAVNSNAQKLFGDRFLELRREWSRFRVRRAWVFGSRATGNAAPDSDWDFLVEFAQPPDFDSFMGLKLELERCLGVGVDLLSRTACKPRFLEAIARELIDVT